MDKLVVVSVDSHAQPPPEMWPEYLERQFHDYLPELREEHEQFREIFGGLIVDQIYADPTVFDPDGLYRASGNTGLYDCDVRLAHMDRDGIAGELVYFGDPRIVSMFFSNSNRRYPLEVRAAGVRAWHRWLHDTFGGAGDRIFLGGIVGCAPCLDLDETLRELDWIADRDFVGTFAPGTTGHPDLPPLSDESWDPFFARCVERGVALVVHAGYGPEQGRFAAEVATLHEEVAAAGGFSAELLARRSGEIVADKFFSGLHSRRAMAQLMFGGVFDRHPELRLAMTEVRADWLPATLRHLDALYEQHRDELPARRRPSDYWASNCLASLSFVHRAEIEMRDDIGIEQAAFGTDYPHPEGTWPNTRAWIADAFAGLPESEARLLLGENAIRFFGLDRAHLVEVAARIGPDLGAVTGERQDLGPALLENFDRRGGYLKPAEGDRRLIELEPMLREDLVRAGVTIDVG
jgi:predicted TIM-barrel fold metal-dependent hydrolase